MTTPSIPKDRKQVTLKIGQRQVRLTNLQKVFWPREGYTKGDLLRYYLAVSDYLLPHLQQRAMVMKRYPNGIEGKHFFMKRTPSHAPPWLSTCGIEHSSGSVIQFPVVDDLAALLWIVNLGCIDLNPWYARCDDVHRPDYLHFDLDPVKGKPDTSWDVMLKAALKVREALTDLGMHPLVKTTGSRGLHIYVPIERGPTQKEVWTFSKSLALTLARQHPDVLTAEYAVAKRPAGRALLDYNQNAWGRTLAGVYSVRPRPAAPVSAPLKWKEVEKGVEIQDFRLDNMPQRLRRVGDLWHSLNEPRGRTRLEPFLERRAT